MDQSLTLIDAQVHFVEERLVLVHIPLELYPYFFKSVLRLIYDEIAPLEEDHKDDDGSADFDDGSVKDSEYRSPAFLNVSITPVEVSVICPRALVEKYFDPTFTKLDQLDIQLRSRLVVSDNDYIAMQVLGQGLVAGKRVLELTSPLALAGISIFFISTYFSDYILVPFHSKASVISTLENRGFQFENATAAFINSSLSPTSPCIEKSLGELIPPVTPPPSTLAELQTRTFENLRKRQISPVVDESLRLRRKLHVHSPGRSHHHPPSRQTTLSLSNLSGARPRRIPTPRKAAAPRFASPAASHQNYEDGSGLLLGSKEDYLIPIMLDLRDLPLEASGIVCGVAGRLAEATDSHSPRTPNETQSPASVSSNSVIGSVTELFDTFGTRLALGGLDKNKRPPPHQPVPATTHHLKPDLDLSADAVEISFLSTARAGTIIVGEDELRRAIDALEAEKMHDDVVGGPVEGEEPDDTA
ncbi:hypothetical protein N7494_011160 [Penicillium frequentans]|uniref:CASTOR ACT domain-containing protein n=1 Tax=Penicillium frequentans TaxID=3151616 RepID=A0AAD6GAH8_9EURO|nr:hypothetical protein N7494_011160 [Penicillium glabrum]